MAHCKMGTVLSRRENRPRYIKFMDLINQIPSTKEKNPFFFAMSLIEISINSILNRGEEPQPDQHEQLSLRDKFPRAGLSKLKKLLLQDKATRGN